MSTLVKDYRNAEGIGYSVESVPAGYFRFVWFEDGERQEGDWLPTLHEALRAAADDWEATGYGEPLIASRLRGIATREEKKQAGR
jgi:hypothetical protein